MPMMQLMIGGKVSIPLTPYSLTSGAADTSGTTGSGSSGNGGVNAFGSGTQMRLVMSHFSSSTANGYYDIVPPSSGGVAPQLYYLRAGAAANYAGISATWNNNTNQIRYNMLGQVNWRAIRWLIPGYVSGSSVVVGESFNTSSGTSLNCTPTTVDGGTLYLVQVTVTGSATTITCTGGEGTGNSLNTDSIGSLTAIDGNWRLVHTNTVTGGITAQFAYYRSGSMAVPADISITTNGSANKIAVGIITVATPAYDTGPIGPPASPTPTPTVTPSSVTPTPTPTVTVTPTITPTISVTPTPTPSPPPASATPTPSVTPSAPGAGDTGWKACTTVMAGSGTGNPNGLLALDGDFATVSLAAFANTTAVYKATGLSAALASATVINGVEIRITGYYTGAGSPTIANIGPSSGSPASGVTAMGFTNTSNTYTYGSPTTTFGYTAGDLLALLQSSNSGVETYVWAPFGNAMTFYYDYIEIRVYYS